MVTPEPLRDPVTYVIPLGKITLVSIPVTVEAEIFLTSMVIKSDLIHK